MHKAYARVECVFLDRMLTGLGYEKEFVDFLTACVRSVKYKIQYNGQEMEGFTPSRGLR
jgi:hypothetical protein